MRRLITFALPVAVCLGLASQGAAAAMTTVYTCTIVKACDVDFDCLDVDMPTTITIPPRPQAATMTFGNGVSTLPLRDDRDSGTHYGMGATNLEQFREFSDVGFDFETTVEGNYLYYGIACSDFELRP